MSELKEELIAQCQLYIDTRVKTAQTALGDAQEAGNEEQKSSAGDKHETGRAMMQLEQEKAGKQLEETRRLQANLSSIDPNSTAETVQLGSVVETKHENYFISISAGQIEIRGESFFALSPLAPLAQAMLAHKAGDVVLFNSKLFELLKVY